MKGRTESSDSSGAEKPELHEISVLTIPPAVVTDSVLYVSFWFHLKKKGLKTLGS